MTSVAPAAQTAPPEIDYAAPVTPAEQAEIERKVSKAKSLLLLDHPFFGSAVARRPLIYTHQVPTAAMAATGQMYINPRFILHGTPESGPLTTKHIIFLLAHEALHYMLSHGLRRKHRKPKAWNVACDKVINDTLVDAGVGTLIEGGINFRGGKDYAAEELYDENDDGDGKGPGGSGNDVGDPVDENGRPLDQAQIHAIETQAKIETIQSAKAAKQVGKLPGSIQRIVDEMVEVKTPWHQILERFMQGKVKDDLTWRRPNRRFIHQGLYLPGADDKPRMGPVVIEVDMSGSIGQKELNIFAGHANRILDDCKPEKVYVVYCDSEISHVDEYTPDDFPIKLTAHGGGGTDMTKVFDWIKEKDLEPEVTVILTDGYTPFGDDPGIETVWLMTTTETAPYGTTIHFEK